MIGSKAVITQNYLLKYKKHDSFTVLSDTPLIFPDNTEHSYILCADHNRYIVEIPSTILQVTDLRI